GSCRFLRRSEHFGCERDDLHELLGAQLAGHWPEDAGADGLMLGGVQPGGVAVEADQRAVGTAPALAGTHHHGVVDVALLDLAAGDRILHGDLDDVADRGVPALGAAEHLDAHHFLGTGVVGHVEVAPHLDHDSASSYSAARLTISATLQFLVLDIGATSFTRTTSPSLQELSASWAWSLVERRMYLPYSACLTWRSTSTVTVLSILLLTTRPSTVRSAFSVLLSVMAGPYFF